MAKKTATRRGAAKGGDKRQGIRTADERDVRAGAGPAAAPDDGLTAAERRAAREQAKRAAADRAADPGLDDGDDDEDEGPVSRLPLNHQTLMQTTDRQLPPEATPRPGKTSEAAQQPVPGRAARATARTPQRSVLVEATKPGYYDLVRRRIGDVFRISDARYDDNEDVPADLRGQLVDFSDRWMRLARKGTRERVTGPNAAIRSEHDNILALRHGGLPVPVDSTTGEPGPMAGQLAADSGDPNPLED